MNLRNEPEALLLFLLAVKVFCPHSEYKRERRAETAEDHTSVYCKYTDAASLYVFVLITVVEKI